MSIHPDILHFLLTVVFSFLIGLELKTYKNLFHKTTDENHIIGSARTYTFLGIVGFIFFKIDPDLLVYSLGLAGFTILYAIFYYARVKEGKSSILSYLIAAIVYTFGPLTSLFPLWLSALVFVLIIFILNAKQSIQHFVKNFNAAEFETLGKMVLLSAVILPLLPNSNVIPMIPLSPFKIWLAVVVISAISYGGYLVQKYLFPSKGLFLTGIIGGTYSSTATTVVLAKKAKELTNNSIIVAAILGATAMMYLRLIVITMVFNFAIAQSIALVFLLFALFGFAIAFYYYHINSKLPASIMIEDKNPLELGTAFVFAALFVVMIIITDFVTAHYGANGLKAFSFVVGFTDIDPFILSLLTGKYSVSQQEIFTAIMIAAGSNNILKALYAVWFGGWKNTWQAFLWLIIFGITTIGVGLFAYLF